MSTKPHLPTPQTTPTAETPRPGNSLPPGAGAGLPPSRTLSGMYALDDTPATSGTTVSPVSGGHTPYTSNINNPYGSLLAHNRARQSSGGVSKRESNLDPTSLGVLTGAVGGSFGPFPRSSTYSMNYSNGTAPFNRRDSMASSDVAIDIAGDRFLASRYSTTSVDSYADYKATPLPLPDESLLWDKSNREVDDYLHNPDPAVEKMLDKQWSSISWRGFLNVGILSMLFIAIIGLFAGWPIYDYTIRGSWDSGFLGGWSLGGTNSSGQVPQTNLPGLIDQDTPQSAYTRTGFDGQEYKLVFSDEFNVDGRTFWPGDDPWWEAVNLRYWQTQDMQWYDPDAITTEGGNMVITMTQEPWNNMNFRSGMVQSWNKFCFTGGYIEMNVSLPGEPNAQGYWPGLWTMGNLGRPGFGASNHGTWPYSYAACDVGTLPNQTWPNGTDPAAAKHSGSSDYGGELSWLPGQRLSACTCPGEDHPGPTNDVGRGAPEIDILEGQITYENPRDPGRGYAYASQSIQIAPFDAAYEWKNTSPYIEIYDTTMTRQNPWQGAIYQESLSVNTIGDNSSFNGNGYIRYGFEYEPGDSGRITWTQNGTRTWTLNAAALGPNADTQIGQRSTSTEPMAIVMNMAISRAFQEPEFGKIQFPGYFRIDYVRVYQKGSSKVGCDPTDHPTHDYIERNLGAYMNNNFTTWQDYDRSMGGTKPWVKNRLAAGGCT